MAVMIRAASRSLLLAFMVGTAEVLGSSPLSPASQQRLSVPVLEEFRTAAISRGDACGEAHSLALLGGYKRSDPTQAETYFQLATSRLEECGDGFGLAVLFFYRGFIAQVAGQTENCEELFRSAIDWASLLPRPFSYRPRQPLDASMEYLQALGWSTTENLDSAPAKIETDARTLLCGSLLQRGEVDAARTEISPALRLAAEIDVDRLSFVHAYRGAIEYEDRHLHKAAMRFRKALSTLGGHSCFGREAGPESLSCFELVTYLREVAHSSQRPQIAASWNELLLAEARSKGHEEVEIEGLLFEVESSSQAERSDKADAAFHRSVELLAEVSRAKEKYEATLAVVALARLAGLDRKALELLEQAEDIYPSRVDEVNVQRSQIFGKLGSTMRARRAREQSALLSGKTRQAAMARIGIVVAELLETESAPHARDEEFLGVIRTLAKSRRKRDRNLVRACEELIAAKNRLDDELRMNLLRALVPFLAPPEQEAIRRILEMLREDALPKLRETIVASLLVGTNPLTQEPLGRRDQRLISSLLPRLATVGDQGRALIMVREFLASLEAPSATPPFDEFSLNLASEAARTYDLLVRLELATGDRESAFASAERARASTLLRWYGRPRSDPRAGGDPKLAARLAVIETRLREIEAQKDQTLGTAREELEREISALRGEREDVRLSLKLRRPDYVELFELRVKSLAEVRAVLPERTTLVSYFALEDKTVAWVLDRESWQLLELKPTRPELEESVLKFRAALVAEPLQDPEIARSRGRGIEIVSAGDPSATALGQDLYRQLIAPLAPHLRHPHLLIVPHEGLHRLPWAALQEPETGQFLAQRFAVSVLPAASVASTRTSKPTTIDASRALVLGDPIPSLAVLRPLPAARREAEDVARRLGITARVEAEATESALRAAAPSASLLHLAAHGVQDPNDPRASYLALAADAHQDGRLEAHEIFEEIRFEGRPLVVLSACQSGLGERVGGGEVEGLVRAFLSAGASSVLATLWSIDDQASAKLIGGFYEHLLAGHPAAEALRRAQATMIQDPEHNAPFFWAGFVLTE